MTLYGLSMQTTSNLPVAVQRLSPGRIYGSSVLKVARHFSWVYEKVTALELADAMRPDSSMRAVAVLDADGHPRGIVRREHLFSLVSKPFGREILGKICVAELIEECPVCDVQANVHLLARDMLDAASGDDEMFWILTDSQGLFRGMLSSRDLALYLSSMTNDNIHLAGLLQERLMDGNEKPVSKLWDFSAWSRSALGVGGDFWICKRIDADRVFFSLCDVSGKGVSASLVVSMAWGMMRAHPINAGLKNFLLELNDAIIQSFHLGKYLTGFFAILNERAMSLELSDMGHAHARLFRNGKAHKLCQSRANIPVGIDRDPNPSVGKLLLDRGDNLFVYSDGFVEQENDRGQEWGERGLSRALLCAMQEGQAFRERLPACFDEFRGPVPQQDDVSFIDLRAL